LTLLKGLPQGVTEETTETGAEDFNREEERLAVFIRTTAGDPTQAVGRQSSTRHDAMQMRVMS
jgi:hypothetical protein